MRETLEILMNIIHQLDAVNAEMAEKAASLETENQTLKEDKIRLEKELAKAIEHHKEREQKYIESNQSNESYYGSLEKIYVALNDNYTSLNNNLKKLNNSMADYNKKLENFSSILNESENEKNRLESELEKLQTQVKSLKEENEYIRNKDAVIPEYNPQQEKSVKRNGPNDMNET